LTSNTFELILEHTSIKWVARYYASWRIKMDRTLLITPGVKLMLGASLVLCLTVSVVHAQTPAAKDPAASGASIRAQLIGSWRLVSRQSRRANGELESDPGLSAVPLGVLIYDQSGHVAAQLSRRDRTVAMIGEECQTAAATKGTPDTAQTILGYDAYFGTYQINEQERMVTHHLEAALFPGDVGKDIERHFTISGDQLTITFNTTTRDDVKVTRTLIWERMK
jgi:Lipocalin-like domain